MKKILGSLVWLLLCQMLAAQEDYYFESDVAKHELYVNEPVVLEVRFYKKRAINTVIGRFIPEAPAGIRLDEFELESEHEGDYRIERFIYLVRFEKAGDYTLPLYGEIQKFNEEDIVDSNNHRDAMMAIAASKERVPVGKLAFHIRPGSDGAAVGAFRLKVQGDESSVLQNEPVHFSLTIEGEGDIRDLSFPDVTVPGAKVFVQEGERTRWLEGKTLKGRKINHYAVVAREGFTLPALSVSYFSTRSGTFRDAVSEPLTVDVREDGAYSQSSLLDAKTETSGIAIQSADLKRWGLYLLLFVSGYLAARIRLPQWLQKKESSFVRSVKKAPSQKELLQLLLPYAQQQECKELIARLEMEALDRRELATIKKDILFTLKR